MSRLKFCQGFQNANIYKFMTRTNVIVFLSEQENCQISLHFDIYDIWAWNKFYNLRFEVIVFLA